VLSYCAMLYVYCCLFLSYKMSVFNLTEKKEQKIKTTKTNKHEGNKEQKKNIVENKSTNRNDTKSYLFCETFEQKIEDT